MTGSTRDRVVLTAWAAGFLDGEASFHAGSKSAPHNIDAQIAVAQIRREPLERLVDLFGGKIRDVPDERPTRRHQYRWILCGSARVAACIEAVLPYLTTKKQEAVILQRLCLMAGTRGKRVPDAARAERIALMAELRTVRAS